MFLLKVKARDADEDSSGDIQFSIYESQPGEELFDINIYTGALHLTKPAIDYGNTNLLKLIIHWQVICQILSSNKK